MGDQRKLPQGRLARLSKVAKLGARLGSGVAGAAGRLAIGGDKQKVSSDFHRSVAATLRDTLGTM